MKYGKSWEIPRKYRKVLCEMVFWMGNIIEMVGNHLFNLGLAHLLGISWGKHTKNKKGKPMGKGNPRGFLTSISVSGG
jgi:hypothetical protein